MDTTKQELARFDDAVAAMRAPFMPKDCALINCEQCGDLFLAEGHDCSEGGTEGFQPDNPFCKKCDFEYQAERDEAFAEGER